VDTSYFNEDEYARHQVREVFQTAYSRAKAREASLREEYDWCPQSLAYVVERNRAEMIRHLRQLGQNLSSDLRNPIEPPYDDMILQQLRWYEQEVTQVTLGHPETIIDPALEERITEVLREAAQRANDQTTRQPHSP
jgi:hypothetical protein